MNINLRAAIAAVALVMTAPASAALFTYSFTAGGAGVGFEQQYGSSCDQFGCTNEPDYYDSAATFTLNGSFTFDSSKVGADQLPDVGQLYYDTYMDAPHGQFMTGSMVKTGGTLPIASGDGGRSAIVAQVFGSSRSLTVYAGGPQNTGGTAYEYHENGAVSRQYQREDYIAFVLNDGFDVAQIGGLDFPTLYSSMTPNGFAQAGYNFSEIFYDEFGNFISQINGGGVSRVALTSLTVTEGATEVPEPAMLGLFGLGLLGLSAGRRRKA